MKSPSIKKAKLANNIITILDIVLALLIITTSFTLVKTQFGKSAIAFGFVMLALSATLTILRKT